jgi:Beta-ketoacyl synthase, N-terminal domain
MPVAEDRFAAGGDSVVIVGMALEAPGGIDTAEAYWELLVHGREALSPFPTDRGWSVRELFAGSRRNGFKEIHDRGGFLTGATTFDDALTADPQLRTRVIVAHRLASIRHADRVLFLDAGKIVEDGSVDELLTAGGCFDEFWRQKREAAEWRIHAG